MEPSTFVLLASLTLANNTQFCAIGTDYYPDSKSCQQEAKEIEMSFRREHGAVFKDIKMECISSHEVPEEDLDNE